MGTIDPASYVQPTVALQGTVAVDNYDASGVSLWSATVTHGLGYVPMAMVFYQQVGDAPTLLTSWKGVPSITNSGSTIQANTYFIIDSNQIVFYRDQIVSQGAGIHGLYFKYYLFAQEGAYR